MASSYKDILDLEDEADAKAQDIRNRYPLIALDFHFDEESNSFILSRIVVHKDKRGQGIGSAVIKELKEFAASKNLKITLTPQPENPVDMGKLKKFYNGLGFTKHPHIEEDLISSRQIRADKQHSDSSGMNVRQWIYEEEPLLNDGDKEIPLIQLHIKADLIDRINRPLQVGDKVRWNSLGLSRMSSDLEIEKIKKMHGVITGFQPDAGLQLAYVTWFGEDPYPGIFSNVHINNIERALQARADLIDRIKPRKFKVGDKVRPNMSHPINIEIQENVKRNRDKLRGEVAVVGENTIEVLWAGDQHTCSWNPEWLALV